MGHADPRPAQSSGDVRGYTQLLLRKDSEGDPRSIGEGLLPAVSNVGGSWDAVEVDRMLANLIDNALKYSAPETPVVVAIRRTSRWAVLSVADRGIGIPATDLPKFFDRGFRATSAVERAPGRGLGLATVERVVRSLRGTLSVDSEPSVGTTFTVRLPLQPQMEPRGA